MGSENRIQKLSRELQELAINARRAREEFEEFEEFTSSRRLGRFPEERGSGDDSGTSASQ